MPPLPLPPIRGRHRVCGIIIVAPTECMALID
jgi:hypothetical protein